MAEILFIKTSSLGDVIHHMPALTEARTALPHARFSWLVEEAFAPLVRLHPAVDHVMPVASRRWRKSLAWPPTLAEMRAISRAIRAHCYDEVVDSQGLVRSAVIARLAHGRRHGYDAASIREPLAARFYDVRHRGRARPACGRAQPRPERPGARLHAARRAGFRARSRALRASGGRYAVLLHATARPPSNGRRSNWIALGRALAARGLEAGAAMGQRGRARAQRAHRGAGCRARECRRARRSMQVARLIAGAQFVVGVDTGLLHLAAALRRAAGRDLRRQRAGPHRPGRPGPDRGARRQGAPPSVGAVKEAVDKLAGLNIEGRRLCRRPGSKRSATA